MEPTDKPIQPVTPAPVPGGTGPVVNPPAGGPAAPLNEVPGEPASTPDPAPAPGPMPPAPTPVPMPEPTSTPMPEPTGTPTPTPAPSGGTTT